MSASHQRSLLSRMNSRPSSEAIQAAAVGRVDGLAGARWRASPHEQEVPADAGRAGAELLPAAVLDVRDVLQLEAGPAVALAVRRTSIQLTSPPYSQVAAKLCGLSQRVDGAAGVALELVAAAVA